KPQQALEEYAQAIRLLGPIVRRQPGQPTARLFLRNSHWGHARALDLLGRHLEAIADWDEVIRLEAAAIPRRGFRLLRADSLARAGDYLRAAAAANDLGRSTSLPGTTLFRIARLHALSAAGAGRDASRPLPEREKRAEEYAHQAVALLRRAATTGFFRTP